MKNQITRELKFHDRLVIQQADQAIRKDVIRALVELITNADDSYSRCGRKGSSRPGEIHVEFHRRYNGSIVRVRDFAEGMSGEDMDKKVGVYAGATSGFEKDLEVRGLYGRGLKDAFFGLGSGSVVSVKDDQHHRCSLGIVDNKPIFKLYTPRRATRTLRNQSGLTEGNGTTVELCVSREDVRMPQTESLRRGLEKHFELRGIMSNPKRKVILRELDSRGGIKSEWVLGYTAPVGEEICNEIATFHEGLEARVVVSKAGEPLATFAEEGEYADAGLIIRSKGLSLGLTLFRFDNDENAAALFGSVRCDQLHQIIKNDAAFLTATRDGVNWRHPVAKSLKEAVEKILAPIVEKERKDNVARRNKTVGRELRKRLDEALDELNKIASEVLGELEDVGGGGDEGLRPFVPASGFGFVPDFARVQSGKSSVLLVRANLDDRLSAGTPIAISSNTAQVRVVTPEVMLEARDDHPDIGEARVRVEGRQIGASGRLLADALGVTAEATVIVSAKPEPPPDPPVERKKRGKKGLFRDVKFDPSGEVRQRVRFDNDNGTIVISTGAPSVKPYIDATGGGAETPQASVLLAELVAEAWCFETARIGVEQKGWPSFTGSEGDAIRSHYLKLQNQFTHLIHRLFVKGDWMRDAE